MIIESEPQIRKGQEKETTAFKVRLDVSTVDVLVSFLESSRKTAEKANKIAISESVKKLLEDDINTYRRLKKSLEKPVNLANRNAHFEYGIDYKDFVDLVERIEVFGVRCPPILRALIQSNDAFVEAGAKSIDERDRW